MKKIRYAENKSAKKPTYIVLCDFSASMDTNSVKYVRASALAIFRAYYESAVIKFYPITQASIKPVFESETISVYDSVAAKPDYSSFRRCLETLAAADETALDQVLKRESGVQPRETYIIQSLENAIAVINTLDPRRENKNKIFILSDMLEYGTSGFGRINLEDGSCSEDESTLNRARPSPPVRIDANIEIKVAYYTSGKHAGFECIADFWKLAFRKLGYSKEVTFSSELALKVD